jgi:hypothetical protein
MQAKPAVAYGLNFDNFDRGLIDVPAMGWNVRFGSIVLQKSKVAGLRIFRENTKREAIADSYNLNRVTEVACEFKLRR